MVPRLLPPDLAVLVALVLVATGLASLVAGTGTSSTLTTALVNAVLVVGLYSFSGTSGIIAFGQLAFMAVGAYTAALLTMPVATKSLLLPELPEPFASAELPALAATLLAGTVAAVAAAVLSIPLARLSGLAAGLASFSVLIVVRVVASNWQDVTRGSAGITAVPQTTTVWVALAWLVAAVLVTRAFARSAPGRRLQASREDEPAARSLGIRVVRERVMAFTLSGFLVGVGGALFAQQVGSFNPDSFYLSLSFLIIAMLVVGGLTSLWGALAGVALLSLVLELLLRLERGDAFGLGLPSLTGARDLGLGLILVLVLVRRPVGLVPADPRLGAGRGRRWWGRARDAEADPAPLGASAAPDPAAPAAGRPG